MSGSATDTLLPADPAQRESATAQSGIAWRKLRETMLWIVVLAGVLNFTPTMFSETSVSTEALWTKALKDIPLLLLIAVAAVEARDRLSQTVRPAVRPFALAVAGLALFIAATVIFHGAPAAGEIVSFRYYVLYPFLALLLAALAFSGAELHRLFGLIVALGVAESLLAIPNFFGIPSHTYYSFHLGDALYDRAIGTLGNPNNLGLFLGLAMIAAASPVVRLPLWARVAAITLMLLGMQLTLSKTATLALGLATFPFWSGSIRRRVLLTLGAAALGAALSLGSIAVRGHLDVTRPWEANVPVSQSPTEPGSDSPSSPGSSEPGTVEPGTVFGSRGDTIRQALEDWTSSVSSFVVGDGFASLADVDSGRLTEQVVDNMPLALAVEGGLVGLVLFTAVVVLALWPLVRRPPRLAIVSLAQAYGIFFLLYAPVAVNFKLFPATLFFWIVVGIALSFVGRSPGRDGPLSRADA